MNQDEALAVIGRIDIRSYPSLMDIVIEFEKHNAGIQYAVNFSIKSNVAPFEWIRLKMMDYFAPEGKSELDIVRQIRNSIAFVLLHELDESLRLDGKVVSVPHVYDEEDGDYVTVKACLCNIYTCFHR